MDDRRVHARVSLECPCAVSGEKGEWKGTLIDISRGGAQVQLAERIAGVGERLDIDATPDDETRIGGLGCEVVHIHEDRRGVRYGLRFVEVTKEATDRLHQFLEIALGGPGGGARQHPRVSRRLDVMCQTAEETRAVMCDLSQGGLGLETAEPLGIGESVTVTVQLGGFPQPLKLKGSVLRVRELGPARFHAGVRFDDLAPERKGVLRDLIQFLVVNKAEQRP